MIDNYIIPLHSMVFMVTAMKTAKDAHQDNLRLNEIPKCVPRNTIPHKSPLSDTTKLISNFLFGDAESFRSRKLTAI